jgi:hypothetical protein
MEKGPSISDRIDSYLFILDIFCHIFFKNFIGDRFQVIHQRLSKNGNRDGMKARKKNQKSLPEVAFAVDYHIRGRSKLPDIVETPIGNEKGPHGTPIGPHQHNHLPPNKHYTNTSYRKTLYVNQPPDRHRTFIRSEPTRSIIEVIKR